MTLLVLSMDSGRANSPYFSHPLSHSIYLFRGGRFSPLHAQPPNQNKQKKIIISKQKKSTRNLSLLPLPPLAALYFRALIRLRVQCRYSRKSVVLRPSSVSFFFSFLLFFFVLLFFRVCIVHRECLRLYISTSLSLSLYIYFYLALSLPPLRAGLSEQLAYSQTYIYIYKKSEGKGKKKETSHQRDTKAK